MIKPLSFFFIMAVYIVTTSFYTLASEGKDTDDIKSKISKCRVIPIVDLEWNESDENVINEMLYNGEDPIKVLGLSNEELNAIYESI